MTTVPNPKVPPQSIEAEQSVLGAILLENEALIKAIELLQVDDFYRESHRQIYGAMIGLYEKNTPVDQITLTEHLKQKNKLAEVGGLSYVAELADTIPTAAIAGCAHIGVGYCGEKEVVRLIHPQQIHPHMEGQDTGDYIDIYGTPEVHMAIKPEIAGGIATIGITVNMIPHIVAATPGMKRMIDLPAPAALMGLSAYSRQL